MQDENKITDAPIVENPELAKLEELKEIGKEIDQLEKKLEAVPGMELLDTTRFNRKQRRQMQRKMVHTEKEKNKTLEQKGNTFVTRKEFVGLFQSSQKLRDRLYYVDILTAALEKLLIEKTIVTEEEIAGKIKEEADKAQAFQAIQKEEKNYEARLKKCLELTINPEISNIGQQLYEDAEMPLDEKIRLAKEYKLSILLKTLENSTGPTEEMVKIR